MEHHTKKYPTLCGDCSREQHQLDKGASVHHNTSAKNWDDVYNDPTQTADTLTEAKRDNKKYYKRECPMHGDMPYATLDNTCRICTRLQSQKRNKENKKFNRPRTILGSARRRAQKKGIDFDLKVKDIREMGMKYLSSRAEKK